MDFLTITTNDAVKTITKPYKAPSTKPSDNEFPSKEILYK